MNEKRGAIGEIFLWLTGRPFDETKKKFDNGTLFVAVNPIAYYWQMSPTGDYSSMTVYLRYAPVFIHRWLQFVILGIRYRRNHD